jgi:hypothetical protein
MTIPRHHEPERSEGEGSAFHALTPNAVRLRNTALGTLSRRARRPAPTPTELEKIRADLDLRDAWAWWSGQALPTQAVRAVRRTTVKRPRIWRATLLTLLASGAWLLAIQ